MARPQKFRHSREALNDPQIAAKLGGLVLDIESLRQTRKQIDDQIAAAFDAVDDAGFEKKYVRKVVSLRAKETDARRDEEEGLEAYEFAVEKGVSLASARSKPGASQSYAEAKGRGLVGKSHELGTTPKPSNSKASSAETGDLATTPHSPATGKRFKATRYDDGSSETTVTEYDLETGEILAVTDTQEQPEEPAANSQRAGNTAKASVARVSQAESGSEEISTPLSPSPASAPRLAIADDEAAQASQSSSAPHSNPQEPNTSPAADKAGDVPPPSSPAAHFDNPRCENPGTCNFAHSEDCCHDCFLAWAKRPRDEQIRLWAEAMEAASETEVV